MDENKNSFVGPDSSLPPDSTASAGVGFSAPAQNSQVYSTQPQVNQTYSAQPQVNQTYSAQAYQQVPQPTQNYPQTPQYISQPPRHSSNRRSDDIILVPDAPKPPKSGRLKYIIFAVVAVVILATCGIVALVVSNNNSPSSPDNSTTAESSADSNSSGSSTDSTPITPTTDLGKAWMRYATYITEGEAREEGLSGEYDEYISYKLDNIMYADLQEQQTYFMQAEQLINAFNQLYSASRLNSKDLSTQIAINGERLKFLSYVASINLSSSNLYSEISTNGPDAVRQAAVDQYSPFQTLSNEDMQVFGDLLLERVELYIELYNVAAENGCASEAQILSTCYNNVAVNEKLEQVTNRNSEIEYVIGETYNNVKDEYLKSLWTIQRELEELSE